MGVLNREVLVVVVILGALMLLATARLLRGPHMPATCATWYAAARSASDSAIVDIRVPPSRSPAGLTCGEHKRLVERGVRIRE
jgi:hypothetical protein